MAFNVTPTSGDGPYTFTAEFLNKDAFNFGYQLRFSESEPAVGACPPPASASLVIPSIATGLLANGTANRASVIPDGECRTFKIEVRGLSNEVLDMQYVSVSNI